MNTYHAGAANTAQTPLPHPHGLCRRGDSTCSGHRGPDRNHFPVLKRPQVSRGAHKNHSPAAKHEAATYAPGTLHRAVQCRSPCTPQCTAESWPLSHTPSHGKNAARHNAAPGACAPPCMHARMCARSHACMRAHMPSMLCMKLLA